MKIRNTDHEEKIELQMTPMIDIVFQLLVFFIMTFKIVLPEGDFNIRMPAAASTRAAQPSESPLLNLRLVANDDGSLGRLQLGDLSFGNQPDSFRRLHAHIRGLLDDSAGPGLASDQEIEIDADYHLRYEMVMRAITAITGYIDASGQRHALIERIRFKPNKPPDSP